MAYYDIIRDYYSRLENIVLIRWLEINGIEPGSETSDAAVLLNDDEEIFDCVGDLFSRVVM